MSSANNTLFYHVYLPERCDYLRVAVSSDPLLAVSDLADAIEKDDELQQVWRLNEPFNLYKYGKRYEEPPNEFHNVLVKWLHARVWGNEYMMSGSLLSKHFPFGPAPIADGQIDVIIVTDSFSKTLRPVAPENQARPDVQFTPRKATTETQDLVSEFFEQYDDRLQEYISGPEWRDFWEASPTVDEKTRNFINRLKIPKISKDPVLLLHDLGNNVVDPSLVDSLFGERSRILLNTPGSGKTRMLLEGLTKYWGFYFTTTVNDKNNYLGSVDLQTVIQRDIPEANGFKENPGTLPAGKQQNTAYGLNETIARRHFCQVLMSRCLVFEWFLKTIHESFPDRSLSEFKKHWLFLQLQPGRLFDLDVFDMLSNILKDASDEYLPPRSGAILDYLVSLQEKFGMETRFYIVVDEAQAAVTMMRDCFRSVHYYEPVPRPVLKTLVSTWKELVLDLPMILSGTSSLIELVNETPGASVGKRKSFFLSIRTGAFDDEDRQHEYILRYMPKHIAQADSGKAIAGRARRYCRGRHRFTAELMTELLKSSFRSPHRTLDAYVQIYSGFRPSDGGDFIAREPVLDGLNELSRISRLDFSRIISNGVMMREISDALCSWISVKESSKLHELESELVELGFARFRNIGEAYINEPLVLLSAANELASNSHSFDSWVKTRLRDYTERGTLFNTQLEHRVLT